jgi:hypothetical protein
MFRVPADPIRPTFDYTTKVSFWKWLFSGKRQREEWMRRRNVAAQVAAANLPQRAGEWADQKVTAHVEHKAAKAQEKANRRTSW